MHSATDRQTDRDDDDANSDRLKNLLAMLLEEACMKNRILSTQ